MKNFISVQSISDPKSIVAEALEIKKNPFAFSSAGKNKTIGLIFMNPSLRTRLSTQKAALNLGLQVMVMNIDKEGWALEMNEGAVMNGTTVEHIKDAAAVMGQYCDIIGIRCFPGLKSKSEDYNEEILNKIIQYGKVPVVSLESATLHPLQSLADMITIAEQKKKEKPKVVLTWAPHIKPLPQAVANSFAEWASASDFDFVITHPEGYELDPSFTKGTHITHNQNEALKDADFVYVKNWSEYKNYGSISCQDPQWMMTSDKLRITNKAKVMHCLPVRRNVELSDEILDGPHSLVQEQAANRVFAAQTVLKKILESL